MGRLCGGAHEISGIKDPIFLHGWVGGGGVGGGGVGDGGVGGVGVGGGDVGGVIRLSFQSNSNSQKLSLWCKKKSLPTQMDLYSPNMVPHTIPLGYYIIFQGVLKNLIFRQNFHIW